MPLSPEDRYLIHHGALNAARKTGLNTIPNELLFYILSACALPSDPLLRFPKAIATVEDAKKKQFRRRFSCIAHILRLVCRGWRAIVDHPTTANLWTTVQFEKLVRANLRILKDCLRRANGRPMTLRFKEGSASLPVVEEIFRMVAREPGCWREIAFSIKRTSGLKQLRDVQFGSMTHLEKAVVYVEDPGVNGHRIIDTWVLFHSSPRMRAVGWDKLKYMFIDTIPIDNIHALRHIQQISVDSLTVKDLSILFGRCPQLEELDFAFDNEGDTCWRSRYMTDSLNDSSRLYHERLHTLHIRSGDLEVLCDHACLPALKRLELGKVRVNTADLDWQLQSSEAVVEMLWLHGDQHDLRPDPVCLVAKEPSMRFLRVLGMDDLVMLEYAVKLHPSVYGFEEYEDAVTAFKGGV
ncbi:hypothetical protein BD626DRAFT_570863 [Schizophyllum amplum]|uniref:F-box domain-containing protein n=1 Tax=Schizophyllum amplum TaxID=97359 RepID=A0A550CAE6_9AGAR|nr:hypothetical protein BD626DRAFT_570863 [Auriculariopsis ampla]